MPKKNFDNIKLTYLCWNVDNDGIITDEIEFTTDLTKINEYQFFVPATLNDLEEIAGTYGDILKGYIRVAEGIVKWNKKYGYKLIFENEMSDIIKVSDEDGNTLDKTTFNDTAYISLLPTYIAGEENSDFDFNNSTVDIWVTENEGDEYIATMRMYRDDEGYFVFFNNEKEYVADCGLLPLEKAS